MVTIVADTVFFYSLDNQFIFYLAIFLIGYSRRCMKKEEMADFNIENQVVNVKLNWSTTLFSTNDSDVLLFNTSEAIA